MKVATEKRFKIPKWAKIAVPVVGGFIILMIIVTVVGKLNSKSDLYSTINTFVAQEVCDFRYVINVRASDHKEGSANADLEKYMSDINADQKVEGAEGEGSDSGEGDTDATLGEVPVEETSSLGGYEDTTESGSNLGQTGKLYQDYISNQWGTAEGVTNIDWNYPNYEVIISGVTESVDPLISKVNISVTTDYIGQDFCRMIFVDDKAYIDVQMLRNWLLNSKDNRLIKLASEIPDNTVYISMDEASELDLSTGYAEIGEKNSGASGVRNLYNRLTVMEKIIAQGIRDGLGDTGLSVEDNKCRLSLSGDKAITLVKQIRGMLGSSGVYYDNYVSALANNNLASEEEVAQLKNEKDNFISAMSDTWSLFASMDNEALANLNANVLAKTNSYTTSTGLSVLDVNVGCSYMYDNKDYIITVYGSKHQLSNSEVGKISAPSETVVPLSSAPDFDVKYVKDYLMYYFKLQRANPQFRATVSFDSISDGVLRDFAELVNETNEQFNGGLVAQDVYTIRDYIVTYASMTEEEAKVNDITKVNYDLVKTFMSTLNDFTLDTTLGDGTSDKYEWTEVSSIKDNMSFDAVVNTAQSTSKLLVIDVDIRNINSSNREETIDLSKWYLIDNNGNKYPCNYLIQLKDMDANFDTTRVKSQVKVPVTEIPAAVIAEIKKEFELTKPTDITGVEKVFSESSIKLTDLTAEQLAKCPSTKVQLFVVINGDRQYTLYCEDGSLGAIKQ